MPEVGVETDAKSAGNYRTSIMTWIEVPPTVPPRPWGYSRTIPNRGIAMAALHRSISKQVSFHTDYGMFPSCASPIFRPIRSFTAAFSVLPMLLARVHSTKRRSYRLRAIMDVLHSPATDAWARARSSSGRWRPTSAHF